MSVRLEMYSGEDWVQSMTFYTDVAQTIPMALTHPQMDIRPANSNNLLAHLAPAGGDGTLTVSGAGSNVLTITLPHAKTEALTGGQILRFDIFDDIGSVRTAIVRSGLIDVIENVTVMSP